MWYFFIAECPPGTFFGSGICSLCDIGMYQPEKNPNYFSFSMIDKEGEKQKVIFHGPPPADFERSEDVVINGKAENGQFIATKILLKCPSKYEDGKMEEQSFEAQGWFCGLDK